MHRDANSTTDASVCANYPRWNRVTLKVENDNKAYGLMAGDTSIQLYNYNTQANEWLFDLSGGKRVSFWYNNYDMSIALSDIQAQNGKQLRLNASGELVYYDIVNGQYTQIWVK